MGKYDIGAELTSECKLSIYDLAKEIADELGLYETKAVEMSLGNGKSGLLKKLKDILKYDAKEIANDSKEEQFRMYKLLKELYRIEKYGASKNIRAYDTTSEVKIPIINILAKPRLSNINTYYSEHSQFEKEFVQIFSNIKLNVKDADERIRIIELIETYWQSLSQFQYNYVAYDEAMDHKKEALRNLKNINTKLNKILMLIDNTGTAPTLPTEGVMETFFNILLTFKNLCYEEDRIRLFNYINMDFHFNKEYTELFKKYEKMEIDIYSISSLKEFLSWADEHQCREDLYYLLSYGEEIPKSEYKHYDYAIEHCKTVLKWLQKEKESMVLSDHEYLVRFLSVIQEFVYIKKYYNENILSDYYGYKNVKETLTSPFKHPEKEPAPAIIDVWIRRVETRFWSNYGTFELIAEKNKADVALYKIKKYIFNLRNLKYLKVANDFLFHQAALCHINCNMVIWSRRYFEEKLACILKEEYSFDNSKSGEKRFRELLSVLILESYGEKIVIKSRLKGFAKQIAQFVKNRNNSKVNEVQNKLEFELHELEGCRIKYNLRIKIDKEKNIYSFQRLTFFNTKQEKVILIELGLRK